ncbi:MAG: hypothetical protein P8Y58_16035 [Novosphingobium sp.]
MRAQVELTCEEHPDRSGCPDCLIGYHTSSGLYGILIHDGGSSMAAINYCPWCGTQLPAPDDDNEDYPIHE